MIEYPNASEATEGHLTVYVQKQSKNNYFTRVVLAGDIYADRVGTMVSPEGATISLRRFDSYEDAQKHYMKLVYVLFQEPGKHI